MQPEPFELVVAESVQQQLLVAFVALVVENEQRSQTVKNSTFFEIVINPEILFEHLSDSSMVDFLLFEFNARIECSIKDGFNGLKVVDENLVIDTDLIEEGSCPDPLGEEGKDVVDMVHEDVLGFGVVEAEKSEVLENREEKPTMHL